MSRTRVTPKRYYQSRLISFRCRPSRGKKTINDPKPPGPPAGTTPPRSPQNYPVKDAEKTTDTKQKRTKNAENSEGSRLRI